MHSNRPHEPRISIAGTAGQVKSTGLAHAKTAAQAVSLLDYTGRYIGGSIE